MTFMRVSCFDVDATPLKIYPTLTPSPHLSQGLFKAYVHCVLDNAGKGQQYNSNDSYHTNISHVKN